MKSVTKLVLVVAVSVALVQVALAASSVVRSKTIIQNILRHDATLPSNAQLSEIGMAFLYHPASGAILREYLEQKSLALNPADETKLEDIGTLDASDPPVFTPATTAVKNRYLASVHRRNLRKYHIDAVRAYRLLTANAPSLPIEEARASVITTAESDAAAIVGDNADDPES